MKKHFVITEIKTFTIIAETMHEAAEGFMSEKAAYSDIDTTITCEDTGDEMLLSEALYPPDADPRRKDE